MICPLCTFDNPWHLVVACIVRMTDMRPTHLRHVDLNLLLALHALLEERHVTRAAKRCFLSQPAMSRALERLREMFGDPLLIRSGRAYERTVRGDSLLRELQWLLPRLESMVHGQDFDPQRSQERFRLAVTDHASITLVPPLIRRIRSAAPDIRLEVSWQDRAYEAVIEGKLDAAFSAEHPPSALQSEVLFEVDFVCVVGTAQKSSIPSSYAGPVFTASPCGGRNLGGRTNSRGPSAGSVWREAACCPQRSILCGSNVRSCGNGPGPDCAAKTDKACPANRWRTLSRAA
jgi:Bacterial regulatory helix-turn-helix protein, lysR family/LysR substrate binding domain